MAEQISDRYNHTRQLKVNEDGSIVIGGSQDTEFEQDGSTNALTTIEYEHHEIHAGGSYFVEGHVTLGDGDPDPVNFYIKLTTPNTTKLGHWTWTVTSNGIADVKVYENPTGGMASGSRGVIHANNRCVNCWSGRQDGGDAKAILTDSTASWTPDALIDMQVFNQTDGSSGFITDNDATTVTATLAGGTNNNWDDDDVYEINNTQMVVVVDCDVATSLGLLLTDTAFGGIGFKADVGGGTKRTNEIVSRTNTTYLAHIASGSESNIVTFSWHWYEHTCKN